MGYQWFSLTGITPENRPARVRAARDAFDATLQQLMAQHAMAGAWQKVILVGFSQGSIMALDALASGRYPLAGVVAFSGRLAFDEALTPPPHASALLIHGKADEVIPFSETVSAAQRLQSAGARSPHSMNPPPVTPFPATARCRQRPTSPSACRIKASSAAAPATPDARPLPAAVL